MAKREILFTGVPGFIGNRLVEEIYQNTKDVNFYFVCEEKRKGILNEFMDEMETKYPGILKKMRYFFGDISEFNLGLMLDISKKIKEKITHCYHLAAIYDLTVPESLAMKVNYEGTKNVLKFLEECPNLQKHIYISTCYVAGDRTGMVNEADLEKGQGFKNFYESTKFLAEKEVRKSMDKIPTIIIRPSVVVGDSKTGETVKYDGPYFGIQALYRGVFLVMPGSAEARVNVVPVDFITKATWELTDMEEAVGKTFQLADPEPIMAKEMVAEICRILNVRGPLFSVPPVLLMTVLDIGPINKIFRIPKEIVSYFNHKIEFDTANVKELLGPKGIECPKFKDYLPVITDFYVKHPNL